MATTIVYARDTSKDISKCFYTESVTPSVGDKILNVDGSETGKTISAIGSGYIEFEDGWVESTLPSSADWNIVKYGGGKFVALAQNTNKSAYSTDGINWTAVTLPITANWSSMAYGNNTFVAVADGSSQYIYSTDGVNWTLANLPSLINTTNYGQLSIDYGYCHKPVESHIPSFQIVIAGGGFGISGEGADLFESTDGVTWSVLWPDIDFIMLSELSSNRFICSRDERFSPESWDYFTDTFISSYDKTYVQINNEGDSFGASSYFYTPSNIKVNAGQPVCYGNGKYLMLAENNTQVFYIAYYQNNCRTATLPSTADWSAICYGNNKYVIVANNSNKVAYSEDGEIWKGETLSSMANWSSITYGNGKFVAVAKGSNKVAYCLV